MRAHFKVVRIEGDSTFVEVMDFRVSGEAELLGVLETMPPQQPQASLVAVNAEALAMLLRGTKHALSSGRIGPRWYEGGKPRGAA